MAWNGPELVVDLRAGAKFIASLMYNYVASTFYS